MGRRAPRRGDKWHLDEVVLTIGGKRQYLWRAVDKDGFVLDVLVQGRRNAKAAKRKTVSGVEHRQHKGLNNQAENSHQPTRRRERQMKRFTSAHQVQRVLSIHDPIANLFNLRLDHRPVADYRIARTQAFEIWAEVAGAHLAT